jgi:hypothetical protein
LGVGSGHVAERETLFFLPVHERLRLGIWKVCGLCGVEQWTSLSQLCNAGEVGTGVKLEGRGADTEVGRGGDGNVLGRGTGEGDEVGGIDGGAGAEAMRRDSARSSCTTGA